MTMNDSKIARKVALRDLAVMVANMANQDLDSQASSDAPSRMREDPAIAMKAQANVAPARLMALDRSNMEEN
jgi:hypothetical protein